MATRSHELNSSAPYTVPEAPSPIFFRELYNSFGSAGLTCEQNDHVNENEYTIINDK
jgi:hypothetical protein